MAGNNFIVFNDRFSVILCFVKTFTNPEGSVYLVSTVRKDDDKFFEFFFCGFDVAAFEGGQGIIVESFLTGPW